MSWLAVGLGAALGAWLRWGLSLWLASTHGKLPIGTLAANLGGGYLIGVLMGFFAASPHLSLEWRLFAITGFLGGLTTFSTFSAEVVERALAGQFPVALALACLHLAGSLTATWLGLLTVGATRIWG